METDASVHAKAADEPGSYGRGGFVVVIILLTLAILLFGVFAWVVGLGILQEGGRPAPAGARVDAGGMGAILQDVVGVVVLGVALAGGMAFVAGRDRRKDKVSEAATRRLYDEASTPDVAESDQSPERRPAVVKRGEEVPDYSRSA